jgi:hypothetical protein
MSDKEPEVDPQAPEIKPGVPSMPDPGRPETFGGGGGTKETRREGDDKSR